MRIVARRRIGPRDDTDGRSVSVRSRRTVRTRRRGWRRQARAMRSTAPMPIRGRSGGCSAGATGVGGGGRCRSSGRRCRAGSGCRHGSRNRHGRRSGRRSGRRRRALQAPTRSRYRPALDAPPARQPASPPARPRPTRPARRSPRLGRDRRQRKWHRRRGRRRHDRVVIFIGSPCGVGAGSGSGATGSFGGLDGRAVAAGRVDLQEMLDEIEKRS